LLLVNVIKCNKNIGCIVCLGQKNGLSRGVTVQSPTVTSLYGQPSWWGDEPPTNDTTVPNNTQIKHHRKTKTSFKNDDHVTDAVYQHPNTKQECIKVCDPETQEVNSPHCIQSLAHQAAEAFVVHLDCLDRSSDVAQTTSSLASVKDSLSEYLPQYRQVIIYNLSSFYILKFVIGTEIKSFIFVAIMKCRHKFIKLYTYITNGQI